MIPPNFVLPSSPVQRCLDRFSIADNLEEDDDGLVPFWPLLVEILKKPVTSSTQLLDVLDTISNLLRGSSGAAGDYGTLKTVVEHAGDRFFGVLWPRIVQLALRMPEYLPDNSIPVLRSADTISLTRAQTACLVAHQFLCSLQSPPWRDGYFDFSIWYASEQRHPAAVDMYFAALFCYLEDLEGHDSLLPLVKNHNHAVEDRTTYSMHAVDDGKMSSLGSSSKAKTSPVTVIQIERYSTEQQESRYQGPNGAVVVSANEDIGFGQSATQEELFVGNCPEACPAVLFTPPLRDDQVLVISGARPMLRISGQRRDISWTPLDPASRRGGRMLFMDALEIDELDDSKGLPDLQQENLDREIRKAYTAFSSWDAPSATVWAGIWGCGAFNGDPAVKMTILWIAASLANKELHIICDPLHGEFPAMFSHFVEQVPSSWTARDLRELLDRIPKKTRRLATMEEIRNMVQNA